MRRLIARGHLKATRLGDTSEWRITPSAVLEYLDADTPDHAMPPLDDRQWFATDNSGVAEQFATRIRIAAAEEQQPTIEEIDAMFDKSDAHRRLPCNPASITSRLRSSPVEKSNTQAQ